MKRLFYSIFFTIILFFIPIEVSASAIAVEVHDTIYNRETSLYLKQKWILFPRTRSIPVILSCVFWTRKCTIKG